MAGLEAGVGLAQDVVQQTELVEEVGGARLEHLAELALERLVPLQHEDADATLGQEQSEHEAGRAAAHDAHVRRRRRRSSPR